MLLLACSAVFHVLLPGRHLIPAVTAIVLLALLLVYRKEFYAVGDPRTRWRALWALGGLAIADVAIGLTYISLTRGLDGHYTFPERLQSVISQHPRLQRAGAVHLGDPRRPVRLPHRRPRDIHAGRGRSTCSCARPGARTGAATGMRAGSGSCWPSTENGIRSATSRCATTRASSGRPPASPASATGCCPGSCWPAATRSVTPRPGPGAIHAFLDEAARHAWVPGGDRVQRARRRDLVPGGRADRAGARRRGHRQRRRLHAAGPVHAQRPADGDPGLPARLRGRDPPDGRHPPGGDRLADHAGRLLAREPDRAGLLHGARPGRGRRRRATA